MNFLSDDIPNYTVTHVWYEFQQHRPDPPAHAEQHLLSDYQYQIEHKSIYAEYKNFFTTYTVCPGCVKRIEIDHGQRIKCECGLWMENYGNSLVIWKDVEIPDLMSKE